MPFEFRSIHDSILSRLNLVVAAVLRDSLCVVSLLPCVADCCRPMSYTMRKFKRFILTIIKRRLLSLLLIRSKTRWGKSVTTYCGCRVYRCCNTTQKKETLSMIALTGRYELYAIPVEIEVD